MNNQDDNKLMKLVSLLECAGCLAMSAMSLTMLGIAVTSSCNTVSKAIWIAFSVILFATFFFASIKTYKEYKS